MRLTQYEIESIKKSFLDVFGEGKIYLFGSRVDDEKKGGDIDLYIECEDTKKKLQNKITFLVNLKEKIGDQKIDVIISKDKSRVIEQEAIKKGIEL